MNAITKNIVVTDNTVVNSFADGCTGFDMLFRSTVDSIPPNNAVLMVTHYHAKCIDGSTANALFRDYIFNVMENTAHKYSFFSISVPQYYSKPSEYVPYDNEIISIFNNSKNSEIEFVLNWVDFFPQIHQVLDAIASVKSRYGFLQSSFNFHINVIDHHSIPSDVQNALYNADELLQNAGVKSLNVLFDGNNDHCGAMIVYKVTTKPTAFADLMLDLVDGRDRFKQPEVINKYKSLESWPDNCSQLQDYRYKMDPDFFSYGVGKLSDSMNQEKLDSLIQSMLSFKSYHSIVEVLYIGETIISHQTWAIENLINDKVTIKQNPYTGGMYALVENSIPALTSNLGKAICDKFGEMITFVVIYNIIQETGSVSLSFRSGIDNFSNHIAVNNYASIHHGGGGHPAAAGSTISWESFRTVYIEGCIE